VQFVTITSLFCLLCSYTCTEGHELRCSACIGQQLHHHPLTTPSPSQSSHFDVVEALLSLQTINSTSSSPYTGRFERGKSSPPRCSVLDRYRMVIYKQDGMTQNQIVNKLHCSTHTIRKWNDAFEQSQDETLKERPGKRGRPTAVDSELETEIVEFVHRNPFITPKTIRAVFDVDASKRTIDRMLIRNNLYGRRARRKHPKVT
jgi:transposase